MQLRRNLKNIYKVLRNDEDLLRLLHYYNANLAQDNPLDETKPSILGMDIKEQYKIVSNVLLHSDKKYDLDLKSYFSRVCVYTGGRRRQQFSSGITGRYSDNPYASDQEYVLDVYSHADIDGKDSRLMWICDRINELMFDLDIKDFGNLRWDDGFPIMNSPKGFVGFRLIYIVTSSQEPLKKGKRR